MKSPSGALYPDRITNEVRSVSRPVSGIVGKGMVIRNHEIPDKVFQRELKEYRESLAREAAQRKSE